jgi:hypothetical protein
MRIARRPAGFAAAAFAILAGMEMAPSARAQAFTAEFIRTAPLQERELFKHAAVWMVESFGSARPFIQVKSERLGTIVGRGMFDINIAGDFSVNRPVSYELRIDVRDNRYRVTFSDVEIPSDGIPRSIEYSDRETDERQVHEHFAQLVESLGKHLAAASEYETVHRSLMWESCTPSLLLEGCGAQYRERRNSSLE